MRPVAQSDGHNGPRLLHGDPAELLTPLSESRSGPVQDKQKLRWAEIILAINKLFEGDVTDSEAAADVDSVIKGELLELPTLRDQAAANTKKQFSNSPTLQCELTGDSIDPPAAHQKMSTQALGSEIVRVGILSALMGPGLLWERLREGALVLKLKIGR